MNFICIQCPIGCTLTYENKEIRGYRCKRGLTYGLEEMTNPKRMITSTVKTTHPFRKRLSVKTSKPAPKELIFPIMEEINKITITTSTPIGKVLIKNVLNSGVDIITTDYIKFY